MPECIYIYKAAKSAKTSSVVAIRSVSTQPTSSPVISCLPVAVQVTTHSLPGGPGKCCLLRAVSDDDVLYSFWVVLTAAYSRFKKYPLD